MSIHYGDKEFSTSEEVTALAKQFTTKGWTGDVVRLAKAIPTDNLVYVKALTTGVRDGLPQLYSYGMDSAVDRLMQDAPVYLQRAIKEQDGRIKVGWLHALDNRWVVLIDQFPDIQIHIHAARFSSPVEAVATWSSTSFEERRLIPNIVIRLVGEAVTAHEQAPNTFTGAPKAFMDLWKKYNYPDERGGFAKTFKEVATEMPERVNGVRMFITSKGQRYPELRPGTSS